ncbi:MAG: hypothetical protein AB8F78_12345 [Saprospiraceae bacterium]
MKHTLTLFLFAAVTLLFQAPVFGQSPAPSTAKQKLEKVNFKNTNQAAEKGKAAGEKVVKGAKDAVDGKSRRQDKSTNGRVIVGDPTNGQKGKVEEQAKGKAQTKKGDAATGAREKVDKRAKSTSSKVVEKAKDRVKVVKDKVRNNDQQKPSTEQAAKGKDKLEKAAKKMPIKDNKLPKAVRADESDMGMEKGAKAKGNAYGKNKGDLSKKAFGVERAKEAKLQKTARKAELAKTITKSSGKAAAAHEKVATAKAKLEEDKKAGRINDAAYTTKKAKIDAAEKGIKALESDIESANRISKSVD